MDDQAQDVAHRVASAVDVHVGGRVKLRRANLGMSQAAMAAELGITWQQCAKYERGFNRIGAARLFDLSNVLDVPIGFFFDDMSNELKKNLLERTKVVSSQIYTCNRLNDADEELITRKDTWDVLHAFFAISNPNTRKRILELMRSIADTGTEAKQPPAITKTS